MNGLALTHYVSTCVLSSCHWASEPLHTKEAAHEARRAHLSGHAHGELVDYVASMNPDIAQYERAAKTA
jgi:hypothetical protein